MAEEKFTDSEKEEIIQAIKSAELNTSGEIRVHIENHCKEDVLDRAAEIFNVLKLHKTTLRNGVLFYMAIKDHKFAILGDRGINEKVSENFWDNIKEHMAGRFKAGMVTEGLVEGIKMAGRQLKQHFPIADDDKNELSDDISFGKN